MTLDNALNAIGSLDIKKMDEAKYRLDKLTKPLGSLGKLEDIVIRLAGIAQTAEPSIEKRAIVIMCSDNGVCEEGVSSCPKDVTSTVTKNFQKGLTGINVFAKMTNSDIVICDIGVDDDLSNESGILQKKIRRGTHNISKGPAMSREEAIQAIEIGISIVEELNSKGYQIIGTGEMGIGNTTTSSAVTAVLTNNSAEIMTGRGSGLSNQAYSHKTQVIKNAIEKNAPYSDIIDVLAKLGGFDIAGLAGCFIGAAVLRLPCVIDGFISASAALVACKICPQVKDFIFTSHKSDEQGTVKVFEALEIEAPINLNMRLGEGTGAALSFMLFDAALEAYYKMGTFEDASITQYVPQI